MASAYRGHSTCSDPANICLHLTSDLVLDFIEVSDPNVKVNLIDSEFDYLISMEATHQVEALDFLSFIELN